MGRYRKLLAVLKDVSTEMGVPLINEELERAARLAEEIGVPTWTPPVKNFLTAYLRVVKGWKARDAGTVASSSRGRRHWERLLRVALG